MHPQSAPIKRSHGQDGSSQERARQRQGNAGKLDETRSGGNETFVIHFQVRVCKRTSWALSAANDNDLLAKQAAGLPGGCRQTADLDFAPFACRSRHFGRMCDAVEHAQLQAGSRHRGDEREDGAAARFFRPERARPGRLRQPPDAAPQVELPARAGSPEDAP
jgi:hypothetical protein